MTDAATPAEMATWRRILDGLGWLVTFVLLAIPLAVLAVQESRRPRVPIDDALEDSADV